MSERLTLFRRVFRPDYYHRKRLFIRDSDLQKQLTWPKDVPRGMRLPAWLSLLLGTVQAADFVLDFAELGLGEEARLDQEARYERFKQKQKLFEYAVLNKSVQLQVEMNVITDRHNFATVTIFVISFIIFLAFLVLEQASAPQSLLVSLSTLGFASILMIFPMLALFSYGLLLRTTHKHIEEIGQKLTRLSAASHAFKALDQVKNLQKRLDVRGQEAREEMELTEQRRQGLDIGYRANLAKLESSRLKSLLDMSNRLATEAERLAFLSAVLPQQVGGATGGKAASTTPSVSEKD